MTTLPTTATASAAWPEGVIARYLTVAGATVDITYVSNLGELIADCTACPWQRITSTSGQTTDTPEEEQARVEDHLPISRHKAQEHAEKCRALTRPSA